MRKIENFAQISDLLNAQLKKGVITNNFLRGDDYTREIANGLYIHEAGGALLLFRERGDHLVMTFYLHPNGCDRAVLPRQGRGRDGQCRRAVLRSRFS